jgi:hypothetical protein
MRPPAFSKGVVDGHMDGQAVGAKCVTTRRIGGANRPSLPSSWTSTRPGPGACGA